VQANTVIKPLQGKINVEGHGDATVLKPLENSFRGLAVSANVNPRFMERDPYWGACSAVDETCRNITAVGGIPDALLDCLNFGNPEKPERMGEFYQACHGLGESAKALHLPFMSGNVSFYNESVKTAVPPTPEIVGIGIVSDVRKCVTSDFKEEGNLVYLVGKKTESELGGSEYFKYLGIEGGKVPRTDMDVLKQAMKGIHKAITRGIVASCHDVSEGGIAVCLAEMAIGGDRGVLIDISKINEELTDDVVLFSESNTRWVIEVNKNQKKSFEKTLKDNKTSFLQIGKTNGDSLQVTNEKQLLIDVSVDELRKAWKTAIWKFMG
jgi:phosphoribosylformylglycinamidine synthase